VSSGEDITERKRAENELRESEERFRSLYENATLGMYRTTPNGEILLANPALINMLGYSSFAELSQRNLENEGYEPEYERNIFRQTIESNGIVKGFESEWKRKDGATLFVRESSKAIQDAEGKFIYYEGTVEDITEHKREEQEIISLAKFPSENPGPVIRLSRDGIVMYANAASGALLSMWRCVVGDSAPQVWRDLAAQVLARRENKIVDTECDGKVYAMFVTPVTESGYVNLYGRDITERIQAEKRVRRQLEHLTALGSIDRFIASVFDLNLVLSEILTHVTIELGVDAADILMLNPNSKILEYSAEHGFRTNTIKKAQVRLGESYAGRAAMERQLVQIPNLRDEPHNLFLTTLLKDEDFVCYYGVPLIFKGKLKGVLEVFHRASLEPDAEWFNFFFALAGQAAIAIESSTLFESLQRSSTELAMAYDATIEGWSRALDLRDKETEGHTQRVTEMTITLARTFGLSEDELVNVRWGALLHDIGKMGVPDAILLKPGPLTNEEWVAMKKHPVFAYEMLAPIHYLRQAMDIPYCHHEKWDGTGYPRGLKGEQIPLAARIFAVVDVWDALTSDRPYRPAWPVEKVLDYIRSLSGKHFDPQVVKICLESGLLTGQKRT
jgi:PAS domain S-box-containing protein